MFKQKNLLFIISLVLILTVFVGSTLAVIIVKTDDIMNIFRPQDPTGALQITKTVQHPFDATYTIPDNVQFRYKVELGADMAGKVLQSSAGDITVAADGTVVLTIKSGLRAELRGIPSGKEVRITEIDIPAGFTPTGGAQKTTTIPMRSTVAVEYVNVYDPVKAPVNMTLDGVKELEGREWMEGDSFTFALSHKQDGAWQELGTRTVTYDAQNTDFNKFSFSDTLQAVAFDKVGTYSFRISEVKGTIGGIDYENEEKTVSYVDVTVTDTDMDGALEISSVASGKNAQVTEIDGIYAVAVTIRNTYAPDGTAQVAVKIHKTLDDRSGRNLLPEGFSFQLLDAEGNVVATSDPTGAAGETSITLTYQAIDAGEQFSYTLQEIKGNQNGMTYDETVHKLIVEVIDDLDGTISAVIYKAGDTGAHTASCTLSFTNTYDPLDTSELVSGTKKLSGRDLASGEFQFLMYSSVDGVNIPEGTQPLKAVNNGGAFAFEEISYDKVGVYRYIVTEDSSAKLGGVTYDESRYYVTVTVTDENGKLSAAKSITDAYGEPCDILFRNSYSTTDCWLDLFATKTLSGADLTSGQFTFLLYQANSNLDYDAERPLQVVRNNADGEIEFKRITYKQTGTWRYVVLEDTRELAVGMTADDAVYSVTVVVTDNGEGKLIANTELCVKTQVDDGNGGTETKWQKVDKLTFHNVYEEPPTTVPPTTEVPSTTQPSEKPDSPETGDDFNLPLAYALMIVSFVGLITMIVIAVVAKKRKKED